MNVGVQGPPKRFKNNHVQKLVMCLNKYQVFHNQHKSGIEQRLTSNIHLKSNMDELEHPFSNMKPHSERFANRKKIPKNKSSVGKPHNIAIFSSSFIICRCKFWRALRHFVRFDEVHSIVIHA